MTRLPTVLLGLMLCGAVGCAGSEEVRPSPYALSERSLFDALARLATPATDSAAVAERAAYAAQRMRDAGLMPAFASSFRMRTGQPPEPGDGGHVLGYVSGRHPSDYDTLVIVAADLDTPAAAAVLETARRLALEALDDQVPARSLLFVLWSPPRRGAEGLADYLSRPTWGLDRVASVVLVSGDTAAVARSAALLAGQGLAFERLDAPPHVEGSGDREALRAATLALAERLYERARALGLGAPAGDTRPHVSLD